MIINMIISPTEIAVVIEILPQERQGLVYFTVNPTVVADQGAFHDDIIIWKIFFALLAICAGNSPAPGEFPAQRPVTRSCLIGVWINGWVNNREAGDLRRYHAHYDVIVMPKSHRNS